MLIKTKDFNYINIEKSDIITFPQGVYAFEEVKKFVILKNPGNSMIMHLQSTENEDPRFVLIDPFIIIDGYKPILPSEVLKVLKASELKELSFFVIAVIPKNIKEITVNLKSPVVINFKERLGAQVILENKDYSVCARLFTAEGTSE